MGGGNRGAFRVLLLGARRFAGLGARVGLAALDALLQVAEVGVTASGTEAHFQVSFWTAIGMALLLLSLGIMAGMAPAYRAMSIKPVDAMRDE